MNSLPASAPLDANLSLKEATQPDLLRQKMDMDALRSRLGDSAGKQEKLRDACEGFEAIFLQKMWEQMRKTVPKEGYLHSKDEESYQSLFDIELCKKMASAGGIGLADMLYGQLSQQIENSGRTTNPSGYRTPLAIEPTTALLPLSAKKPAEESNTADAALKAEYLYSPLIDDAPEDADAAERASQKSREIIMGALDEIRGELGMAPKEKGLAAQEWAEQRHAATGFVGPEQPGPENLPDASGLPGLPGAATAKGKSETPMTADARPEARADGPDPASMSWQGPGPVSAAPRPFSPFAGRAAQSAAKTADEDSKKGSRPAIAPENTIWPLQEGRVTASFGWEEDQTSGRRRWNPGIRIDAPEGTPVRAVLDGTVVYTGQREGAGNSVILQHSGGYRSYYGNLMPVGLRVGDKIKHGAEFAKIAVQDSSRAGEEKSASLHFELKKGEMALNPEAAISRLTAARTDKL